MEKQISEQPGKRKPTRYFLLVSAFVLAVLLSAYYLYTALRSDSVQRESLASGQLSQSVAIGATAQRSGDPKRGRHSLLNSAYVDCGLPLRISEQINPPDPAQLLPGRGGAAARLPYFNNLVEDDSGQQLVSSNCLLCHAAPLFGEIVIGLGNEFLDFTDNPSRQLERAGTMVRGPQEEQAWRKLADRINAVAPYSVASTVGVNIANNLTYALIAHRDATTLEWSDTPLITPPDTEPLPVSVPPWWRMAKKNAMFYQGQARGDHARFMMTASILCADDLQDIQQTDSYAADIRAYIASLQAPDYPFDIDHALAQQGRDIYRSHCARCHGSADDPAAYPNLLIPLEQVGTDPALARQLAVDYRRFIDQFEKSFFGQGTEVVARQGYVPPPLDGIWATGPFLHNGSVPTIEAVLDSGSRPAYWRHTQDRQFDQQALGWTYQRLDKGKDQSLPQAVNKHIYDTSLPGYGNAGHIFGDALTSDQRRSVIEFLKTL